MSVIDSGSAIGAFSARCSLWSARHAGAVVLSFVLASGLLGWYASGHLGVNTETEQMISEELPWRQTFLDFKAAFPQLFDTIIVVIDAATPELARDAQRRLADALAQKDTLFESVATPGGGEFFRRHGLLYLETDRLERLADELAVQQPLLARLRADASLGGLAELLDQASAAAGGTTGDQTGTLSAFADALQAAAEARYAPVSWSGLLGSGGDDSRRLLVVAKPRLDRQQFQPGAEALAQIRSSASWLELDPAHGIDVRLTGPVALEHDELGSVRRGAGTIGLLAFVMVTATLMIALRAARLVVASIVTLLAGLAGTAGFAGFAVGHLNLISVAFAILYVGLGIDFAIHYCLRYRELIASGLQHEDALVAGSRDVGASLVLCALTTSVGFFAFIPTDFVGVSELGIISGTGVFISLLASLILLPALLTLAPLAPSRTGHLSLSRFVVSRIGERSPRLVRLIAAALALGALLTVPHMRFESDPLDLRDPDSESVQAFEDLLDDPLYSPLTLSVLVEDRDAARQVRARTLAIDGVEAVVSIDSFIPDEQPQKLALIDEMALTIGPERGGVERPDRPLDQRLEALERLAIVAGRLGREETGDLAQGAAELGRAAQRLSDELVGLDASVQQQRLALADANLFDGLGLVLSQLRQGLAAQEVTLENLPEDLRAQWIDRGGRHRVELLPQENLSDNEAARRFVARVGAELPEASGLPLVYVNAGEAVVGAFRQAVVSALVVIGILLLVLLGNWRDPVLVLTPVLLAGLTTAACTVLFDMPFNFANVIALPLLLGVGVDNGVHIVHRYRAAPDQRGLLETSTARAVIFSALTTIFSFGNLAISPHVGMASMGRLLTIGMVLMVVTTLVVLPALLVGKAQR